MAIQVTNRIAAISLRGQNVKITLDATETANKLSLLTVGQIAGVVSSGLSGTISSIDYRGNSFLVKPRNMGVNMASTSTPGYVAVSELINID